MVSSPFTDLGQHRSALIRTIDSQGLKSVAMEHDSAKPGIDVIDSSLQMVRDASAYVGVISRKYGQTPECPVRNPDRLSLTELEFNEASRLGRPILLFIMDRAHPVTFDDVEQDPENKKKLNAFRERAKRLKPNSSVQRIYKVFNSLHEFEVAAIQAIADLRRYLDQQTERSTEQPQTPAPTLHPDKTKPQPFPSPPAFYAEPPYIGSHEFLGRNAQLDTLSDWAAPADPHPVLLFVAIGGAGKSMLAWEWTTKHATNVRRDWAGCFWYSFYEKGAVMADFCQRGLAYITCQPLEDFRRKKTAELSEQLLHHLRARPWLFILDGLERVLVAYHRFDAAQVADEEAGAKDQIAHRDPCAAIRPEDDDLLRGLAAAGPSKLILTSRLIPRVLLNPAGQPIPGVLRERLPGLRPPDAEALLRAGGVTGTSADIQSYLKSHCDCHPLVTGVLAGLINNYLPDRASFDAWAADLAHGGQLNLANLDLVQKRNHILHAALAALPKTSRELLSTLALLSEAVDYPTLSALNPHLPSEPPEVEEPQRPEDGWRWEDMSDDDKKQAQQEYQTALEHRHEYEQVSKARQQSPEFLGAPQELAKAVRDLELRGLLQYDARGKRYDLHPVVRGVAAGGLRQEDKDRYGQRVIAHFSQQAHSPYENAETLDDTHRGLHVVRTLLQMGRYEQASSAYLGDLSHALFYNLEANAEVLSLLRPFFPQGWATLPREVDERMGSYLANDAALALMATGALREALAAMQGALLSDLRRGGWSNVRIQLSNISSVLSDLNREAKRERCLVLALNLAVLLGEQSDIFCSRLDRFTQLTAIGQWTDAEALWQILDPMGRDWPRPLYRPGRAEHRYALFRFCQGNLREEHIVRAEQLAKGGRNRGVIRFLHGLRGEWQIEQGHWALAAASLHEAVRMAREVGQIDTLVEAQLALAKFHLHQLPDPCHEAELLANAKDSARGALADLWFAIGDREEAKKHVLAAYSWAWADGEPYVRRYELNKARALLELLGVEIPNLAPYDPVEDEKLPWEDEVAGAIETLRPQKRAEEAAAAEAS